MIDPVQKFDDSYIDISVKPEAYKRFVNLIETEPHPEHEGKTYNEAVIELGNSSLFHELPDDEKQVLVDKITDDYEDVAKDKLRSEYPVIDQLILEDNLKKEQQQLQ